MNYICILLDPLVTMIFQRTDDVLDLNKHLHIKTLSRDTDTQKVKISYSNWQTNCWYIIVSDTIVFIDEDRHEMRADFITTRQVYYFIRFIAMIDHY